MYPYWIFQIFPFLTDTIQLMDATNADDITFATEIVQKIMSNADDSSMWSGETPPVPRLFPTYKQRPMSIKELDKVIQASVKNIICFSCSSIFASKEEVIWHSNSEFKH